MSRAIRRRTAKAKTDDAVTISEEQPEEPQVAGPENMDVDQGENEDDLNESIDVLQDLLRDEDSDGEEWEILSINLYLFILHTILVTYLLFFICKKLYFFSN